MKQLFILLLLVASTTTFAQIQVKEVQTKRTLVGRAKNLTALMAELTFTTNGDDTTYALSFNDAKYKRLTQFQTITFHGGIQVLNGLYSAFKSVFEHDNRRNPDYMVSLMVGTSDVVIKNHGEFGVTYAMLYLPANEGYCILTEKQIDKLFDK